MKIRKRVSKKNDKIYESIYRGQKKFFGETPSPILHRVMQLAPPVKPLKVLDVGCGEGRNAVFLARNGYNVTAYDISSTGISRTLKHADHARICINAFEADMRHHRLGGKFDIIFSTGTFQFLTEPHRKETIQDLKRNTNPNGLNVISVFLKKPFIKVPHHEKNSKPWRSGELFSLYWDWKIEYCDEDIFPCTCGGRPHQHAANNMIARKIKRR